jgi:excisionase family DNA binding protein
MVTTTTAIETRYISLDDAAIYAGTSKRFLQQQVARGELRVYRPGGRTLTTRDDIDAMMQRVENRRVRKGRGIRRPTVEAGNSGQHEQSRCAVATPPEPGGLMKTDKPSDALAATRPKPASTRLLIIAASSAMDAARESLSIKDGDGAAMAIEHARDCLSAIRRRMAARRAAR